MPDELLGPLLVAAQLHENLGVSHGATGAIWSLHECGWPVTDTAKKVLLGRKGQIPIPTKPPCSHDAQDES